MTDPLAASVERYAAAHGLAVGDDELRRVLDQHALRREKLLELRATPHPFGPAVAEPATAERWIERGGRSA
jgi:hypothetical protein